MKGLMNTLGTLNKEIASYPGDLTISDERFPEYQELIELRKNIMRSLIERQFSMRKGSQEDVEKFAMGLMGVGLMSEEKEPNTQPDISQGKLNMIYEIFAGLEHFPQLRIGQFLMNVVPNESALYNRTDTDLMNDIRQYIETHSKKDGVK